MLPSQNNNEDKLLLKTFWAWAKVEVPWRFSHREDTTLQHRAPDLHNDPIYTHLSRIHSRFLSRLELDFGDLSLCLYTRLFINNEWSIQRHFIGWHRIPTGLIKIHWDFIKCSLFRLEKYSSLRWISKSFEFNRSFFFSYFRFVFFPAIGLVNFCTSLLATRSRTKLVYSFNSGELANSKKVARWLEKKENIWTRGPWTSVVNEFDRFWLLSWTLANAPPRPTWNLHSFFFLPCPFSCFTFFYLHYP